MKSFRRVLTAAALLALAACNKTTPGAPEATPASPTVVHVTGIPLESPDEMQRKYKPMVDYLEQRLGTKVEFIPVTDYGAAVQALAAKKVDFAWLGGFTYVQAKLLAGAQPLCQRDIDTQFHTLFIHNTANKISKLEDLKGKKFSFGSKSSTSGHLMPRHFLLEAKIDPDKDFDGAPVYSGAHDATVKLVESGKVDAGALDQQVWQRMIDNKQVDASKVAVFWTTPAFVDYLWVTRGDVDPALQEKFKQAFLDLDITKPEQKPILDVQGATKYVPANAADYQTIEDVGYSTGLLQKP
jgi:phosphonate transport system substrate-binding protein